MVFGWLPKIIKYYFGGFFLTIENSLFSVMAAKNNPNFWHLFFKSRIQSKIRKMPLKISYFWWVLIRESLLDSCSGRQK
jgi:hypothetical protein